MRGACSNAAAVADNASVEAAAAVKDAVKAAAQPTHVLDLISLASVHAGRTYAFVRNDAKGFAAAYVRFPQGTTRNEKDCGRVLYSICSSRAGSVRYV